MLFFDECESAFRSRDRGGDRLLNALLTEIERHEGIVFMATNRFNIRSSQSDSYLLLTCINGITRPHDIDEAMHRRITTVIPYAAPDYSMRLRIWTSLLSTVASSAVDMPMNVNVNGGHDRGQNGVLKADASLDGRLQLANDVDIASLAVKYELTGENCMRF